MSDESERLLYVVSAKHSMAWSAFKRVFDLLDPPRAHAMSFRRTRTTRILDALGHCDFDFSETASRVYVSAPVLARLPQGGLPAAVLVGARSPETRREIADACSVHGCRLTVSAHDPELSLLPLRLAVEGDSEETLDALARSLGVRFEVQPPSWLIANFAGTLDEYLSAAPWRSDGELNWPRKEFDPETVRFKTDRRTAAPVLIRYANPKRGNLLHLFRRGGRYAEVDCDWGRYAALHETGLNVLVYDERKQFLAVPASAPLPRLFARSLGLCSGYAPHFVPKDKVGWPTSETCGFDIFHAIPSSIANMVAEKLGQSLVPRPMKVAAH